MKEVKSNFVSDKSCKNCINYYKDLDDNSKSACMKFNLILSLSKTNCNNCNSYKFKKVN